MAKQITKDLGCEGVIISKFDYKIETLMNSLNGINKPEPPTEETLRKVHLNLFGHTRFIDNRKIVK